MSWATISASLISLYALCLGAITCSAVFYYLWRTQPDRSLGVWSLAFFTKSLGAICAAQVIEGGSRGWEFFFALLEISFVVLLVEAWRSHERSAAKPALKALYAAPIVAVAVSLLHLPPQAYWPSHWLMLAVAFLWAWRVTQTRSGGGSKPYRFLLLCLAGVNFHYCVAFSLAQRIAAFRSYSFHLRYAPAYESALCAALALCALWLWVETRRRTNTDPLTGLLNRSVLSERVAGPGSGVVAVCDIDDFKKINDRYGHLTGDEVLRNVAHLVLASIRQEDEAFRWGGDEIVILFHNQDIAVVQERMRRIEARLLSFRLRKQELLPVALSWGVAQTEGRSLLQTLEAADLEMYAHKRSHTGRQPPPIVG